MVAINSARFSSVETQKLVPLQRYNVFEAADEPGVKSVGADIPPFRAPRQESPGSSPISRTGPVAAQGRLCLVWPDREQGACFWRGLCSWVATGCAR